MEFRVTAADFVVLLLEKCDFTELLQADQTRAQAIVDIVTVVGDLVRQVGELCFQAGLGSGQKTFAQLPQFTGITLRTVLEDTFSRLKGQVEARKICVAFFQFFDHAQ